MTVLVRSDRMSEIDSLAQSTYSLSSTVLMENAGVKLYRRLLAEYRQAVEAGPVVFLVGKGNNGGDALVMARQAFVDGYRNLVLVCLTDDLSGDPKAHLAACRALSIPAYLWPSKEARAAVADATLVLDGVFGTGIRGELRGPGAELVAAANEAAGAKVAIDVPSGLGDEFEAGYLAFRADTTLTVELPKRCLYLPAAREYCGRIEVVPIGFPPALLSADDGSAELADWTDARGLIPPFAETVYKTKRGVVGIFAGAPGTSGAAALCAAACGRSRAGLVHLFAETDIYVSLAAQLTSVLVHPWKAEDGPGDLAGFTAVAVGPGWGRSTDRRRTLSDLAATEIAGVVDADGLNVLYDMASDRNTTVSAGGGPTFRKRWVLTPHPGECSRLVGVSVKEILSDPVPPCRELAGATNAVVVLKSHVTYIVPPARRVRVVDGNNAALATGGSGDVLTGTIAALLAAGIDAEDAAVAGVLVHAEAGRRCRRKMGWFLAEDLPAYVGVLFEELVR